MFPNQNVETQTGPLGLPWENTEQNTLSLQLVSPKDALPQPVFKGSPSMTWGMGSQGLEMLGNTTRDCGN